MKKIAAILICFTLLISVLVVPTNAAQGEYRNWLQSDSRWGSMTFGNVGDTLSKSGCAIVSIAKLMVHSGAEVDDTSVFNPATFCTWLKETGGVTSQGWLIWDAVNNYKNGIFTYSGEATLSGTKAQKAATIASYINDGHVVVAMVKNGGHYVAVDKVVGSNVYIMDPANTGYTDLFSYDAAGVTKLRIYKGPHNGASSPTTSYDTTIDPLGASIYTITSDNGVNLRSGAGTSYGVLTAIPYNTSVTVTKIQNGWGYTTYDGQKGWFSLEFAKTTVTVRGVEITPPTKTQYLVNEKLDTTGLKVTVLYSDGSSKTVTSGYTVQGFSSTAAGNYQVYVCYGPKAAVFSVSVTKPNVIFTTGIYAINSNDGLNLRSDKTTTSQVLTTIPHGTRVEVTQVAENWGKTTYQGLEGWICLDYTKLLQESVKQTGITVKISQPCFLSNHVLSLKDFTVTQVFSDGSQTPTTDFSFSIKPQENNKFLITITQGEFSQGVTVQMFDAIPIGDSNFDGKVNATDALNILRVSIGKTVEPFYTLQADVNGDQLIDAKDALLVLRFAVNNIDKFPVELQPEQPETPEDPQEPTPEETVQ